MPGTISGLPDAGPLTGNEAIELEQNGLSVQASVDQVSTGAADQILSTLIITNTENPDLVNTTVPLNVGAVDPTAAQHIEVGSSAIQSKGDGTTAGVLSINSLGGNLRLGAQSGLGTLFLHNNGFERMVTSTTGRMILRSDGNTDTENRHFRLEYQDGTNRAIIGHNGSNILRFENRIHGASVRLVGEDSGGVSRTLVDCDPDGAVELSMVGTSVARTLTAANGGFEVNNEATAGGFERALTESDLLGLGTVTGSRGGNAALASLLTLLDTAGIITDNST